MKNSQPTRRFPGSQLEFILLTAGISSMVALAIDAMLPALGIIADDFALTNRDDQQFVILVFLLGLSVGQVIMGPLSDAFGRRRILILSISGYCLSSLAAAFATSFETVLLARALQGLAGAGGRILVSAIVRDLYEGRAMARIMSLTQIAFVTVPVIAPLIGAGILLIGTWPSIFLFMTAFGAVFLIWAALRLPETRDPQAARQGWRRGMLTALTHRPLIGYSVAGGAIAVGLVLYLSQVAQIFEEAYRRPDLLAPCFAATAFVMGFAAYGNARLVLRLGMKRLAFVGMAVFLATGVAMAVAASLTPLPIFPFMAAQAVILCCYATIQANLAALALEQLGSVAGAASSLFSAVNTALAVAGAGLIGAVMDGRLWVYFVGISAAAVTALIAAGWTQRSPAQ